MRAVINRIRCKLRFLFFRHVYKNWLPCSIVGAKDTLEELFTRLSQKSDTTYLRFGDGDIFLLNNISGRKQIKTEELQREYKVCFAMHGKGVIKSIPIHSEKYGFENGMAPGSHLQSDKIADILLSLCAEYFVGSIIYSPVALHHSLIHEIDLSKAFFKELKKQCDLFVGSEKNDLVVVNKLLSPNAFIKTPPRDAYSEIDNIFNKVGEYILSCNTESFITIVFSCGTTAKILMKRIRNAYPTRKFYLFDLGSVIDVFHGRDDWTWVLNHKKDLQKSINQINGVL